MNLQNLISGLGILNEANHNSKPYAHIKGKALIVEPTDTPLIVEEVEDLASIGWYQESWLDCIDDEDCTFLYKPNEHWVFK